MEFENVKKKVERERMKKIEREKIERECQRIGAAFGVKVWQVDTYDEGWTAIGIGWKDAWVNWSGEAPEELVSVSIGSEKETANRWDSCDVFVTNDFSPRVWGCRPHPLFGEHMVRGLYCLGFEEENVLRQLPQLTAHQKLELRLSMPHEFWPKKWMDEEANPDKGTKRSST